MRWRQDCKARFGFGVGREDCHWFADPILPAGVDNAIRALLHFKSLCPVSCPQTLMQKCRAR